MKLNTTPQNQISPLNTVDVRTDTLRHALADLREHGLAIAQAMGATGYRDVRLDDGTELHLTQMGASERGCWLPGTCECLRLDDRCETVARYAIHPRD